MNNKKEEFKSGFAVMVGRSNVGKSTLLNALVGTKVSITTQKPQTTRDIIQGVVHDERGQIIFIDTPGFFKLGGDKLTAKLTQKAKDSLKDVDVVLYIVDPTREIGEEEQMIQAILREVELPKIMVINKIDLEDRYYEEDYLYLADEFDEVIKISALKHKHLKPFKDIIFKYLKSGEKYYPSHQFTSMRNEKWFAELIREKFFAALEKELPYKMTVNVREIEKRDNGTLYIDAEIITSKPNHKGMIIGRGGRVLKEIGTALRKEMEMIVGTKVFLDLKVIVNPRWVEQID